MGRIASFIVAVVLLTAGLTWVGCTPRPGVMPTPDDDLAAAWNEFQHELVGLGGERYWDVRGSALRELPALKNLTWTKMVSAMGGNSWGLRSAVMRCAGARLDGTVMTLTLRYGLVLVKYLDDELSSCWSGACEVRVVLDLGNVNNARSFDHTARNGWLAFELIDGKARIAERAFDTGPWTRCRMDQGLLNYGRWGDYYPPEDEHRVRPCYIPDELSTEFGVLVERAKRVGPRS